MNYDFFSPNQIKFGWGRRTELGTLCASLGERVFLVSGSRTLERRGLINELQKAIAATGLTVHQFEAASHEPEVSDVDALVASFLKLEPTDRDVVVAIGGGSTIDLAKAAAACATNRQSSSVVDFLEGVGRGYQISERPLSVIAVPTTAGTGTEVTKNAVISSYSPPFKKSLRSDLMIPRMVLVDPELTVSLPRETTAYTGMDAITQLIESFISRRAAPIPQALALSALAKGLPALLAVVQDGTLRSEREIMSHAALLSGMALANSGLGFAHGVAAALGVHCRVPHGLACAVMLPAALRVNQHVSEKPLARLEALFDQSHPTSEASAAAFIARIDRLCHEIGIPPRLRSIGVEIDQLPAIAVSSRGNSMNGNPRDVSDSEVLSILQQLW
ncbi:MULTISPECIES: iron-containing alcohol dehydrogenase [unclassified Schlesneria]|uniref:iron-containing alcohol dehydrogenase n=1 Tax=unclassified Schlesneria TaxID=2762017 RepID=UPI002EFF86B0